MSRANSLERQMLDLINEERTSRGLDPLQLELNLNESSEDHSEWMLNRDVFSHTGVGGSSAGDRMRDANFTFSGNWTWGENIAYQSERGAPGLADDVIDLHNGLMNSPGHRANILNPDFDLIGIGIEQGDYQGFDAVMVTQNFAATDGPVRIDGGTQPPDPEPNDNTAPIVKLGRMTFEAGEWLNAGDMLRYRDADGDAPKYFMVRSTLDDFTIEINGEEVTGKRHRIDADDIDTLRITADNVGDRGNMQIRAHDGTEWGDWDSFRLRAVQPGNNAVEDDQLMIAQFKADTMANTDQMPAIDQFTFDLPSDLPMIEEPSVFLMA